MQTPIGYVKSGPLQEELDAAWGQSVFTVVVEDLGNIKNFFLNYADGTPQASIDGAVAMAAQNTTNYLNAVKINLYERLNGKAEKAIAAKNPPIYTAEEITLAVDWLANQQLPVPGCVQFLSLTENISTVAAAQIIAESATEYKSYIDSVNAIKTTAQSQIMSAPDVFAAKQIAADAKIAMNDI